MLLWKEKEEQGLNGTDPGFSDFLTGTRKHPADKDTLGMLLLQAPTFKTPALTRQLRRTNWALQEGDRIGTLRKGDRIGTTPVASQAWKDSTGKALAASLD